MINIKHLSNSELTSMISGGVFYDDIHDLLDIIDDMANRLDQAALDSQDTLDDISNVFDEFEEAYNAVSGEFDTEVTDEYTGELKTLKSTIREEL